MNEIASRFLTLQNHIAALETQYNRPPGSVQILAVTKTQSVATIQCAIEAGIRMFGENYLQEALDKIPPLAALAPEWHYIGRLQSNKTRQIAAHFAWVHTVTSNRLALRLHEQRPKHLPPLNICIQLSFGQGDNRGGIQDSELLSLAEYCAGLDRLCLRGLMAMPTLSDDPKTQRAAFHRLQGCYHRLIEAGLTLDTLSAGTTHDLEAAIAEGATLVRIGTALFGPRKKSAG